MNDWRPKPKYRKPRPTRTETIGGFLLVWAAVGVPFVVYIAWKVFFG
jgi:hypothetical protein